MELGRICRYYPGRNAALEETARLALHFCPADSAAVLLYDPSSRSAYVPVSVSRSGGEPPFPEDITLRVTDGSCLQEGLKDPGKPLFIPEGESDPVLAPAGKSPVAVVPMAFAGETAGFLLLTGGHKDVLRSSDADLLMALASHAALLASVSLLKDKLGESEERYRMLTENAAGLAFVLDQGGRFLYVNQRSNDVLGYEPHELVGRYFGEFVTPESWAKTTAALKEARASRRKYVEYEWVAQRKDGREVTLHVQASLIYQGHEIHRHQGIARDTSAELILKEELRKTDSELSQVRSREERMRDYLTVASMAQEEERARIAREIHDGAVQYLVAMRRRLDLLKKEFGRRPSANKQGLDGMSELDSLLDAAISDLREFARNLRPPVLDDFGLVSACEWLADLTAKEGINVRLSCKGEARRLPKEIEVSAFRIVQEALANVVKHSGAGAADVALEFGPRSLSISVFDDGRGFDFRGTLGSLGRAGQMGLVGMFERAELMGATVDLQSEPGKGTRLRVTIPLESPCADSPTQ